LKDKQTIWIIILLGIVIILQLLIKFPIQIQIEYRDCPEIIYQPVICKTTVEVINKTVIESEPCTFEWNWFNGSDYVDDIKWVDTRWKTISVNTSSPEEQKSNIIPPTKVGGF